MRQFAVAYDEAAGLEKAAWAVEMPSMTPANAKRVIPAGSTRSLKSFPSPEAVNTTTGPQLPKYVSAALGSLDLPWKPGHLRSAHGAICCHRFKPKISPTISSSPKSSVTNSSVTMHPSP
jgi:hypothetical protein